ncbi:MAG TPA: beta-ketoacyl synthase N-terminal-like domain-containing protein [Candidatus Methanoperedens sp.]|nr:beta-ketoacyl synthase N-terminal-like domain-containing protein [Candidatus Methanoperedens sp.]
MQHDTVVPTRDVDPVWVTGVGVLTGQGAGGRDAVRLLRARFLADDTGPAGDLPLGDVDFARLIGGKGLRHLSRGTLALLAAAYLALEDAGAAGPGAPQGEDAGVAAGTATATAGLVAGFDRTTLVAGPQAANPAVFPQTVWNGPACQVAIRHALRGPNVTLSSGMNSGLDAVLAGARLIRRGRARMVLAGGFEEITPYFRVLLEPEAGETQPCLSEGAAVLVLERRSAAEARGARPLGAIDEGASAFAPCPGEAGARLRALLDGIPAAGATARAWCLGPCPAALADRGTTVDLCARAGHGGGLTGALAVALAASGAGMPELVAASDRDGRVAALVVGPIA